MELSGADLHEADLTGTNLSDANLLIEANLREAALAIYAVDHLSPTLTIAGALSR